LKTYRATDLAAALSMARTELGPQALVLATREVDTPLGVKMTEITAGVSRKDETEANREVKALKEEIARLKKRGEGKRGTGAGTAPASAPPRNRESEPAFLRQAADALVAAGLSRDLAARFTRIGGRRIRNGEPAANLAVLAEEGMSAVLPFTDLPMDSRCILVVGPAGAGKTTTVAKLAARLSLARNGEVRLGIADIEKIGAVEQAAIFARHLGIQHHRIDRPRDLLNAIARTGVGGTLVLDTPGIGACDLDRMERIVRLRALVPDADVVLLVPAGVHRGEAEAILERFAPLDPTCIGFSRVDDGAGIGELVTAAARRGIPLSFLTNGHRVPDDLLEASPRGLATMMLRTGFDAGRNETERSA